MVLFLKNLLGSQPSFLWVSFDALLLILANSWSLTFSFFDLEPIEFFYLE